MQSSGWLSAAIFPVLAETPMPVDSTLFTIVAGLGVIACLTIGVVYRSMHGQLEKLRIRGTNAESELRTLLSITDDAVLVLSADGTIREVNPGAEELFGRTSEDMLGGEVTRLLPQQLALAEATRNGPTHFTATATPAGAADLPVEVFLAPVDLVQGRSYLLLSRPALSLVQPAVVDLAEPVAKFCHDLNNQFTGLLGNLSLALMTSPADATLAERLTKAKRAALAAQEMTRKMQLQAKREGTAPAVEAPSTIVTMPAPAPRAEPVQAPTSTRTRVLVLDDEEIICSLVASALDAAGYEAVEANSSKVAIEACATAVREGRPFRLVVADLSLPGEMDGQKTVARMRQLDPEIKAVISSGYDHDPVMNRFHEHGFSGAVTKPYEMGHLVRLVQQILNPSALKTA